MIMNRIVALLALVVVLYSCNNDDGGANVEPPLPLSEVLVDDEAKIQEYLKTHYYNYTEFESPAEDFDYKIELKVIPEGNTEIVPLSEQVTSETVKVTGNTGDGDEDVSHTYYYLIAKEGAGGSPTYADSTFVKYEGTLLNGDRFDGTDNYIWQYLPNTIRGYAQGFSQLRAGGEVVVEDNGTYSITDPGVGMVIMPSGLGYFNNLQGSIPAYSPLVFTLELGVFVKDTDYDNDGIPSILEDVNEDGNLNNDNTDGDVSNNSFLYNHRDSDDDNDGILTRDEIEIDENGVITYPDTDGDGVVDYLDSDS
ncbi:hypothetical protein ACU8V7_04215 [Zobellia nedashkovskayae]